MSKRQIIMILGVLVIIVALFSGLPPVWNTFVYVVIGILVIATAYLMLPTRTAVKPQSPYMESEASRSREPVAPAPSSPEIKQ